MCGRYAGGACGRCEYGVCVVCACVVSVVSVCVSVCGVCIEREVLAPPTTLPHPLPCRSPWSHPPSPDPMGLSCEQGVPGLPTPFCQGCHTISVTYRSSWLQHVDIYKQLAHYLRSGIISAHGECNCAPEIVSLYLSVSLSLLLSLPVSVSLLPCLSLSPCPCLSLPYLCLSLYVSLLSFVKLCSIFSLKGNLNTLCCQMSSAIETLQIELESASRVGRRWHHPDS